MQLLCIAIHELRNKDKLYLLVLSLLSFLHIKHSQVKGSWQIAFHHTLSVKLKSLVIVSFHSLAQLITDAQVVQSSSTASLSRLPEPLRSLAVVLLLIVKQRSQRIHSQLMTLHVHHHPKRTRLT